MKKSLLTLLIFGFAASMNAGNTGEEKKEVKATEAKHCEKGGKCCKKNTKGCAEKAEKKEESKATK